jgi:hypothetical protein
MRRQFRFAAHPDATGDRQPAALVRPLDDAFALPFGDLLERGKEPAKSSDGKSSTRRDAPASITSLTIWRPSHIERVQRSHSASTSTSPGARPASAAARFGRPTRDFPDADNLSRRPFRGVYCRLTSITYIRLTPDSCGSLNSNRIDCGMLRPSAFAVFRLMTGSNLHGCSTEGR